ncbi:hypothetical protein ACQ859_07675 [Roseateles chitinivorans]|uniref:hypothetical protein n=1 Tax=Roseateles chitinivorans TaxID=2917965 RepID=UPI003D665ABC
MNMLSSAVDHGSKAGGDRRRDAASAGAVTSGTVIGGGGASVLEQIWKPAVTRVPDNVVFNHRFTGGNNHEVLPGGHRK